MVFEYEELVLFWYSRFVRYLFFGKNGVNFGVMFMNLIRMRVFNWIEKIFEVYYKYKFSIIWGD